MNSPTECGLIRSTKTPNRRISFLTTLFLLLRWRAAGRKPIPKWLLPSNAMLKAQRPEGSWEGDPVYQGFNTPFRATQFAVMALSTLYPGPEPASLRRKKAGTMLSRAAVKDLATEDLPLLLSQLDQFWDLAPASTLKQIRNILSTSDQPLAREAAARALGHMADPTSIDALITALGDSSKMVQRTSAWAAAHDPRTPSSECR